jgi:hypothetical protein
VNATRRVGLDDLAVGELLVIAVACFGHGRPYLVH